MRFATYIHPGASIEDHWQAKEDHQQENQMQGMLSRAPEKLVLLITSPGDYPDAKKHVPHSVSRVPTDALSDLF